MLKKTTAFLWILAIFGGLLSFYGTAHAQPEERCLNYWSVGMSGCDGKTAPKNAAPAPKVVVPEEEEPAPQTREKKEPIEQPFQEAQKQREQQEQEPQESAEEPMDERIDDFLENYGKPPKEFVAFNLDPTLENALRWAKKYNEMIERSRKLSAAWSQAQAVYKMYEDRGAQPPTPEFLDPMPDVPDYGLPLSPAFADAFAPPPMPQMGQGEAGFGAFKGGAQNPNITLPKSAQKAAPTSQGKGFLSDDERRQNLERILADAQRRAGEGESGNTVKELRIGAFQEEEKTAAPTSAQRGAQDLSAAETEQLARALQQLQQQQAQGGGLGGGGPGAIGAGGMGAGAPGLGQNPMAAPGGMPGASPGAAPPAGQAPAAAGGPIQVSYYFSAECPYCERFKPHLRRLVNNHSDKLDLTCVDMTPSGQKPANTDGLDCQWRPLEAGEMQTFGVDSTPTLIINRGGGSQLERLAGYVEYANLEQLVLGRGR